MKAEKNIPALRFPEYEGEWKVDKVRDLGKFVGGGTPESNHAEFWEGTIPWISSSDVIEGDILNLNITRFITEGALIDSATKLIPENSVLIVSRVGIGKFAVNKHELCTSQDFTNLLPLYDNSYFLAYLFTARHNRFLRLSQGTSIKGYTGEDIGNLDFHIPDKSEQQKIASFLTSVDQRIQLLTQKKEKLEQYKKGLMQRIFSQELRFKPALSEVEGDENGQDYPEWEEKILKEIISDFIVPMRDKPNDLTGPIPWCRIEDFEGKYLTKSKSDQGVTTDTIKKMNLKLFPVDTLIVSCSAYLGRCAIVKNELITNQTFIGLIPIPARIDVEFLFYTINWVERELNILSSGTTISYLSREGFEIFRIKVPVLHEQQKIATFFSSIDNKINHINSQIELTRKWKQGLLQQMFV